MIRAAIFDFGGTLAYERDPGGLLAARRRVAQRLLGGAVPSDRVNAAFDAMLDRLAVDEASGRAASVWTAAHDLAERVLGKDGSVLVHRLAVELINPIDHPQSLRLVAGTSHLLGWLLGRGVACGVLSNTGLSTGAFNRSWMARAGLLRVFAPGAVLFSDETGVAKPDAAAFELALERLGVGSGDALFVGDDLFFDIEGARRAGLATVRITRFSRPLDLPEATLVVDELAALPSALVRSRLLR